MFEDVEPNSERWFNLENLLNEIWKDIKNYEDLYQVSNYGRVKRLERFVDKTHHYFTKIMKMSKDKDGYYFVSFYKNGKSKQQRVHNLVGQAFVDNPENKPIYNHLKPVTKEYCNNHYTNLVPSTYSENILYAYKIGRKIAYPSMKGIFGKDNPNSIKINQYDLTGNFIKTWDCINDIERELGYLHGNIISCCKKRYKQAYGYVWRYEEGIDNGMEI